MKSFLTILLVLFISLPRLAMGEEPTAPQTALLEHEGHTGYWFPDAAATKMLADLEELPKLRLKAGKLMLKLRWLYARTRLAQEEVNILRGILTAAQAAKRLAGKSRN